MAKTNRCFIGIYQPGPAWRKGKRLSEQPLSAHVEYLIGLYWDGVVAMGGPFAGGGGLVVLEAEHVDAARAIIAADPAVETGVLAATVREWHRIV